MTLTCTTAEAQMQMTLAGIAYTEGVFLEHHPSSGDVEAQLANTSYATNGDWNLVWGPGYSDYDDNMAYVVQYKDQAVYSIAIRGTITTILFGSWKEDDPTEMTDVSAWSGGAVGGLAPYVSQEFYDGISNLMATKPGYPFRSGDTLSEFLDGLGAQDGDLTIYVTGHSQGGALTQVMLGWLINQANGWSAATTMIAYGFAPPTSGEQAYAAWINGAPCGTGSANQAASFQIRNPNDIVPFAYGELQNLITEKVPAAVPSLLEGEITKYGQKFNALIQTLPNQPRAWTQAGQVQTLNGVKAPNYEPDPGLINFGEQVEDQHNHNTYLALMGANPITGKGQTAPIGVQTGGQCCDS